MVKEARALHPAPLVCTEWRLRDCRTRRIAVARRGAIIRVPIGRIRKYPTNIVSATRDILDQIRVVQYSYVS
eukprot:6158168-Prymnesium_polylepis.1